VAGHGRTADKSLTSPANRAPAGDRLVSVLSLLIWSNLLLALGAAWASASHLRSGDPARRGLPLEPRVVLAASAERSEGVRSQDTEDGRGRAQCGGLEARFKTEDSSAG